MSTTAVSSNVQSQQLHAFFENRVSDLHQLRQNLQTGDVASAQQSFRSLVQLGKSGPFPSNNPFLGKQREKDFQAVGDSLKTGDLQGARQSFQKLIQDFHGTPVTTPPQNGGVLVALPVATPVRAIDLEG